MRRHGRRADRRRRQVDAFVQSAMFNARCLRNYRAATKARARRRRRMPTVGDVFGIGGLTPDFVIVDDLYDDHGLII